MRTDHEIFIAILVLQEQTTIKISMQEWLQSLVKKKIKQLVFIYLVTQNHLYSKILQQTPSLL
jgi:hypothetical protein